MLRNQISEATSTYPQPTAGVNLLKNPRDLTPTEAQQMENCEYYGSLRIRRGSQRLTNSLGAYRGLGGHKFYYGTSSPQNKRLIAYNNRISTIDGTGAEVVLTSGMSADNHTYFNTWSITRTAYISNNVDTLRSYDGTTFATVAGTAIPIPRGPVVGIKDRLLAITIDGIERTSPRVVSTWSANSSWATLRPSRPGLFTAMHPYALRGTDSIIEGVIACQERAYYHITGNDFGTDASAGTASAGEDASIKLLDPSVGTGSPDSMVTVPGVGLFWFTTDLNVFWIPEGTLTGRYIGHKLQSTGAFDGLESTNTAALAAVWMTYHDQILMLGIPTGTNLYATTQWWLDMRQLREGAQDREKIVWYGPMTGQSVAKTWIENQQSDNYIYGLEGNPTIGTYVYQLRVPSRFSDAVGASDIPVTMSWLSSYKDMGLPSREKYIQAAHFDLNTFTGSATLDLVDLNSDIASDIPVEAVS